MEKQVRVDVLLLSMGWQIQRNIEFGTQWFVDAIAKATMLSKTTAQEEFLFATSGESLKDFLRIWAISLQG
jgi:hypothetical protein